MCNRAAVNPVTSQPVHQYHPVVKIEILSVIIEEGKSKTVFQYKMFGDCFPTQSKKKLSLSTDLGSVLPFFFSFFPL